jgi:hypothetical protein
MDKKSPEINQPVSAGHRDLRVSANSAGRREFKNRFLNLTSKIPGQYLPISTSKIMIYSK